MPFSKTCIIAALVGFGVGFFVAKSKYQITSVN